MKKIILLGVLPLLIYTVRVEQLINAALENCDTSGDYVKANEFQLQQLRQYLYLYYLNNPAAVEETRKLLQKFPTYEEIIAMTDNPQQHTRSATRGVLIDQNNIKRPTSIHVGSDLGIQNRAAVDNSSEDNHLTKLDETPKDIKIGDSIVVREREMAKSVAATNAVSEN